MMPWDTWVLNECSTPSTVSYITIGRVMSWLVVYEIMESKHIRKVLLYHDMAEILQSKKQPFFLPAP